MLDYIASKECFTEKDAATITRAVVSVIAHCHPFGVVHRWGVWEHIHMRMRACTCMRTDGERSGNLCSLG